MVHPKPSDPNIKHDQETMGHLSHGGGAASSRREGDPEEVVDHCKKSACRSMTTAKRAQGGCRARINTRGASGAERPRLVGRRPPRLRP